MDCLGIPEVTIGDVGDELLRQLQARRFPLGGSVELTDRCNLACMHCYINQPAADRRIAQGELTLAQWQAILDQVAAAGCLFLLFTGGEPLLRPDFRDIYSYAKRQGMLVSLFTNGALLTPRVADFLAEWRPLAVEITLYGATQETYERVTRAPGSFARVMQAIDLLLERGLRLNLKSVIIQANRHEIAAMKALAERLGVHYRFDGVIFPRLDGDWLAAEQRLTPGEIVTLDKEYPLRQEEYDRLYRSFNDVPVRSEYVYSCGAGHRSFHIDSGGRLSSCMLARRQSYDILQGSFEEGWERFLPSVLHQKRRLSTACQTCEVGALCLQCPAWSQMVHGDDETPVDFVCALGHLRHAQMTAGPSAAHQQKDERQRPADIVVRTGPSDSEIGE